MQNKIFKKLLSVVTVLTVIFNSVSSTLFITIANAQETPTPSVATETPAPTPETAPSTTPAPISSPTPSPVATPEQPSDATSSSAPTQAPAATPPPTIMPVPTPGPTPTPSDWKSLDSSNFETASNVETSKDYVAPQNDKVKVKFTAVSENSGKLSIKEVKLTTDQVRQTGALSDTAYEITSTMLDNTFFYDLTLPIPPEAQNKEIDVKSSETLGELGNARKVSEPEEKTDGSITIHGLNHFTVFVITTPNPDTAQRVLINEILPNPTAGAEWIELYNNGTTSVNLAAGTGWVIRNSAGDSQSLSALGTIAPAGRVVFNAPSAWLSDTAPETVSIINELGSTVDAVTISLTAPGFAIDRYPLPGESVGRKTDGVFEWIIFTSPSKGTANIMAIPATGLVETGPVNPTTGFPSWYKDSNGLALDLMEAADSFGISDPVDPANPFSEQIGFNAEGFWWSAEASIDRPIGKRTILVLAQEAAFAGEAAVDGEQSVQNRLRYRIDGLVPGETYTITHPFGQVDEVANEAGVINVTDDTGCFAGGGVTCNQTASPNFSTPLSGKVGPYLTWTTFNTDPNLTDPQLVNSANPGRRYVGNPSVEHAVTGSPTGNNFFRVTGPDVGGPGVNSIETNLFTVSGRLADANAPVITLFGANPVNVIQNTAYTDAGATALDDLGGNLTGSIQITGLPVDTTTLGVKTVTYTVSDSAGRTSVATRTVNVVETPVVDTTAPVITILGANPASVTMGTPYIDAGATALDNVDGDITGSIVTTNPVNTAVVGAYTVTYNVSDAALNAATPVTRTVNVVADTIQPVITITGSNVVNVLAGASYVDAGATAIDNVDGNVTANIVTTGLPVDTTIIRANTITYTVTDLAGNTASAARTVNVVATLPSGLSAVSAINPANGYPTWYKDSAGIAIQLCLAGADGLADGNCVLPGAGEEPNFNPALPISFPDNFPGEAFWYLAEPDVVTNAGQTGQGRVRFRYALESAFTTEAPAANEQIAFLRVNMQRIEDLVPGATYTVTHPFGQFTMHAGDTLLEDDVTPNPDAGVADDGRFFRVEDGAFAPPLTEVTAASILSAANTGISKFLKQTNPLPPAGYIGDGATLSTIEAGPNGNFVRIEGPSIDVNNYDGDGNPDSLTIDTWTVSGKLADITPPVITLNGVTPVEVAQNTVYTDAGATALDDFDGNVTPNIITTGLPVDTSTAGAKTVTYTVTDRVGNTATATRTVNVGGSSADITAPVITILGANPASVTVGTTYTDAGATALDNVDGDITGSIITVNPVNTAVVGAYTVTYNVSDLAGNAATEATRTVNVIADTTPPVTDTTAPTLASFSSTTADGVYGPGSSINITANFDEALGAGSTVTVTLNTGATVTLNTISANSISGTYTVGALGSGENTTDLTVSAISSISVTDTAGNTQISTILPVSNIANLHTIIVNTTPLPTPALGTITIIADAIPNDPQDFGFRLRSGSLDERFSLDDDGDNSNELSNSKVFSNLTAGSFTLSEDSASNWVLNLSCEDPDSGTAIDISGRTATIDLGAGENITCTFTNSLRRAVTGVAFNDLNGNGVMDNGELGLTGWTVYIDTNSNGILDQGETSALSDVNGNYQFTNLGGGTYTVREILQDGWVQTAPSDGKYNVSVTSSSDLINLHFGNFKKVTVAGSVWKDLNADKIWEALEPGLGGWSITLGKVTPALTPLVPGGPLSTEIVTPVSSINTNAGNGSFSFTVDKTGQYRITQGLLDGWQQINPTDSFFDVFINESGQADITKDKNGKDLMFGNTPFYTISNQAKFVSSSGVNGQTSSVISLGVSTLTVDGNGGISSVTIPDGTVITKVDGLDFDSSQLATSIPALNSISGLGTGVVADGVLQWGIPNLGLFFSNPITLNIFVGTTLNGQTLNVMRSTTGTSGWTDDGIENPKTCVVASGLCSFQATKASFYAATRTVPVTATTTANTSATGGTGTTTSTGSNELSATAFGAATTGTPSGFSAGVLGINTETSMPKKSSEGVLGAVTEKLSQSAQDKNPKSILSNIRNITMGVVIVSSLIFATSLIRRKRLF